MTVRGNHTIPFVPHTEPLVPQERPDGRRPNQGAQVKRGVRKGGGKSCGLRGMRARAVDGVPWRHPCVWLFHWEGGHSCRCRPRTDRPPGRERGGSNRDAKRMSGGWGPPECKGEEGGLRPYMEDSGGSLAIYRTQLRTQPNHQTQHMQRELHKGGIR